ncbi:MAG: hypothetical protein R2744_07875 [Bacteroidales bacterium]
MADDKRVMADLRISHFFCPDRVDLEIHANELLLWLTTKELWLISGSAIFSCPDSVDLEIHANELLLWLTTKELWLISGSAIFFSLKAPAFNDAKYYPAKEPFIRQLYYLAQISSPV